jgi:hypothetical protein
LSSSTPGTLFQCQWHNEKKERKKERKKKVDQYTHFLHIKNAVQKQMKLVII